MKAYPARFEPQEEGGFFVQFIDLPGCVTEGDDLREALLMAQDALTGWLACQSEMGQNIPEPSNIKPRGTIDKFFRILPEGTFLYCYVLPDDDRLIKKQLEDAEVLLQQWCEVAERVPNIAYAPIVVHTQKRIRSNQKARGVWMDV